MDITAFVTSKRDRALLVGDYGTYRSQLSRQLLSLRRKLGRTTPKNAKFNGKAPVTVEDIAKSHEYVHVLLIQAERAWAHAMHIKSTHAEDNASKGISGATRGLMLKKLRTASKYAKDLTDLLSDRSASKASDNDYLEAKAYMLSLSGAEEFERQVTRRFEDAATQKQAWKKCLTRFSEAHVIYSALLFSAQSEVFREFIGGTIDPSIRYTAYQSKLPRTISVGTVAKRNFPKEETEVLGLAQKLDPNVLSEETAEKVITTDGESTASVPIPTSINWRKRTAPISDAAIGQALAATSLAASKLDSLFSSTDGESKTNSKDLAAAYDPILNAAQDAVDAVRRSISDLSREGAAESDSRMQDLRVSDLAVNYGLISWRIGRNRVLISDDGAGDDGMTFESTIHVTHTPKPSSKSKSKGTDTDGDTPMTSGTITSKTESTPRLLARLTTRIVLLDSILQSIDSISALPGATRDVDFQAQLTAQRLYFQALKCLNIGYSHQVLASERIPRGETATADGVNGDKAKAKANADVESKADAKSKHNRSALALFSRAKELAEKVDTSVVESSPSSTPGLVASSSTSNLTTGAGSSSASPTLLIHPSSISTLQSHLNLTTKRQQGLCALLLYQSQSRSSPSNPTSTSAQATSTKQKVQTKGDPLITTLSTYPPSGTVDLNNIVTYPPQLEPVPVKPVFLDLAYYYISYPGRSKDRSANVEGTVGKVGTKIADAVAETASSALEAAGVADASEVAEAGEKKKRGWFGFGR